ncbi:hypothetical protein [Desulfosudis oleivorans]|nr:hypothetical protein [Desulfosudis oleivorans]
MMTRKWDSGFGCFTKILQNRGRSAGSDFSGSDFDADTDTDSDTDFDEG